MKATDILYEEHRIIMKMLHCLQKMVEAAEQDGKLDAESARAAIHFFRNFADGCHHAKEEDRLFVVMEESGVPREGGPIGVMLTEHDSGRGFVNGMSDSVEKASQGDPEAIRTFGQYSRDLISLLQNHIAKEDQVLFPMADNVLEQETAESLLADFHRIEADAGGKRHVEFIEIARDLCARYGVAFDDDLNIPTIKSEFHV